MKDRITRMLMCDAQVYAVAVDVKEMVEEARGIHGLSPVATAALGRLMMGALIIGSEQDSGDVMLNMDGGGPAGKLIAIAEPNGTARGYIQNPDVHLPPNDKGKLDVSGAVGVNGTLSVIKYTGGNNPYTGQVKIQSGEIAEDIAYYYVISEQKPCIVYLGVVVDADGVKAATGMMAYLLPNYEEETLVKLEGKADKLSRLSSRLAAGEGLEEVIEDVFQDMDLKFTKEIPVKYKCNCSKERMQQALISIGEKDLKEIIEEDGKAEIICQFCNTAYTFNKEELEELLREAKKDKTYIIYD